MVLTVVAIETRRHLAQTRFSKPLALSRPALSQHRPGRGGAHCSAHRHTARRPRAGLGPCSSSALPTHCNSSAIYHCDRGAGRAAIPIELRANRAHRGVAARDIEGPCGIIRTLNNRFAGQDLTFL